MPTIAAVNGVAAGAGANIPFACDLVYAAQSASFIQSFAKLGLVPDCGGTWWLPRLMGPVRAMGLTLLGEKLSAAQAAEWGLIWRCVDDDQLLPTVTTVAQQLAAGPTRGYVRTRQAIDAACLLPLEAARWISNATISASSVGRSTIAKVSPHLLKSSSVFTGR